MPIQVKTSRIRLAAAGICVALLASLPLRAAEPTFDELLARAEAEAAAGHGLAPPGDNVAETALALSKMVGTATPAQLNALTALLDREDLIERKSPNGVALKPVVPVPDAPSAAAPAPVAPPAARAAVLADTAVSVRPKMAAEPDARATDLFAHGKAAEARGDISAARRWYRVAAQLKQPAAARCLGRLYDPAFLARTAIGGMDGDAEQAKRWYEVAAALGDPEAVPLVHALSAR